MSEREGKLEHRLAVALFVLLFVLGVLMAYGFGLLQGIAASIPLDDVDDPDEA